MNESKQEETGANAILSSIQNQTTNNKDLDSSLYIHKVSSCLMNVTQDLEHM